MMSILPYSLYTKYKMISKIYIHIYIFPSQQTFSHSTATSKIPIVSLLVSRRIRPISNETLFYSKHSMMDRDNGPLSKSDATYVQSVASCKVLTST